jgi:hypothetical protein
LTLSFTVIILTFYNDLIVILHVACQPLMSNAYFFQSLSPPSHVLDEVADLEAALGSEAVTTAGGTISMFFMSTLY